MKADVIDLDKLESGEDRAALFFAVWSFVSKLSYSFGPWFALILLGSSGFNTAPEALNTPDQLFGLRFLYALSTTLFFGMTIFIIFNFSLNKSRQEEIRKEIELLNQQEGN